jgi:malonate decarboxylase beta subunit
MRESFAELSARDRARALLDPGTFRELADPFARLSSPHLAPQAIVAQSDDGVVIARGTIAGAEAVVASIEGRYLGGSIGEAGGAKIAGALELALDDAQRGRSVLPVIAFDTGGIRLQEANLGLLALAEIHAAIVALREYVPVVGVIAGSVGCFGGMSIAAALCSTLIASEIGRLGLNGPDVIEEEAGIAELDARDRPRIWRTIGGRARAASGAVDVLVDDDVVAMTLAVRDAFAQPRSAPRSTLVAEARDRLRGIAPDDALDPALFARERTTA